MQHAVAQGRACRRLPPQLPPPVALERTCLAAASAPTTSTTSLALASACAASATLASSRTSSWVGTTRRQGGGGQASTAAAQRHLRTSICSAGRLRPRNTLCSPSHCAAAPRAHLRQLHHLRLLLDGQHDGVGAQHARHAAKQQQRARHAPALPPRRRACGRVVLGCAGGVEQGITHGKCSPALHSCALWPQHDTTGAPLSMSTEAPPKPRWPPETRRKMAAGRMKAYGAGRLGGRAIRWRIALPLPRSCRAHCRCN